MPRHHALFLAIANLGAASSVSAAVIVVDSTLDLAADDGVCTLREAIENANNDSTNGRVLPGECAAGTGADEIQLPTAQTITLSSALPDITNNLSIVGNQARVERAALACTLDSVTDPGEFRLLTSQSYGRSVSLSDFTLANGCADGGIGPPSEGGAIRADTNNLVLQNMRFENNRARRNGGAVATFAEGTGSLTIRQSTFSGNIAQEQGGAIRSNSMSPLIEDSVFTGNQSADGGAFHHRYGQPVVRRSTFSGNTATARGGAVSFRRFPTQPSQTLTLSNSTVSGNTAPNGGGIYSAGVLALQNSTVSGNSATQGGGVSASTIGALQVSDSTLADNVGGAGSQIYWAEDINVSVVRSIVSGAAPACNTASTFASGAQNLATDASCDRLGASIVGAASLQLGALQNNGGTTQTRALGAGSVAIDAGGSACGTLDQRGSGRPADGDGNGVPLCDVGAFEVAETATVGPDFVVNATTDIGDGVCGPITGQCTLREAVLAANANDDSSIIRFDAGVFAAPHSIVLGQGEMAISTALAIEGPGSSRLTVDANAASRHFRINDGSSDSLIDSSISGLTLTGGLSTGGGGAILSYENLALTDLTLQANTTAGSNGTGGAIRVDYASGDTQPRLIRMESVSAVQNTSAFSGGGVHVDVPAGSSVEITDSTISSNAGRNSGGGAVINAPSGLLIIRNSQFNDNALDATNVASGGGLLVNASESIVELEQLVIDGNRAGGTGSRGRGGGLHLEMSGGSFTLSDATLSNNDVGGTAPGLRYGGGAYLSFDGGMQALIRDTGFTGNRAVQEGAGLAAKAYGGSTLTFQRTTISGNTAGLVGGGFYGYSYEPNSVIRFQDSTISGNVSNHGGGGLALLSDDPDARFELINTTVTNNRSDADLSGDRGGGGVYLDVGDFLGSLVIRGSIIAGNTDGSPLAIPDIDQQGGTMQVFDSLIGSNAGTLLLEAPVGMPDPENNLVGGPAIGVIDPRLGLLSDHGGATFTHRPASDSPALERYGGCSGDDQTGQPRGIDLDGVAGNDCDAGAVEFTPGIFANGFENSELRKRYEDRQAWLARSEVLARLPQAAKPEVVMRAFSSQGGFELVVVHARRRGERVEIQLNRLEGDEWTQGAWQTLQGDRTLLRW